MSYIPIVGSAVIIAFMLTSRQSARALLKALLICGGVLLAVLLLGSTLPGLILLAVASQAVSSGFEWLCFSVLVVALVLSLDGREPARTSAEDPPLEHSTQAVRRRLHMSFVLLIPILGIGSLLWKYHTDRICVGYNEFTSRCTDRLSLLHNAAAKDQLRLARVLLALGYDVRGGDVSDPPPIIWAIRASHVEMVRLLLAHGASVNEHQRIIGTDSNRTYASGTAMAFSILCGAPSSSPIGTLPPPDRLIAIAKLLQGAGADPNYRYFQQGSTPLAFCIATGRLELARYLISQGVDVNQGSENQVGSPLLAAYKRGDAELIEALRAAGAHCSQQDTARAFFIDEAYRYIQACQQEGFGVRLLPPYTDRMRLSFLSVLAHHEVLGVSVFLEAGMSPNEPYGQGRTPLHVAVESATPKSGGGSISDAIAVIRCLRAYGADAQMKNRPDRSIYPDMPPESAVELAKRLRPELVAALQEENPRCE